MFETMAVVARGTGSFRSQSSWSASNRRCASKTVLSVISTTAHTTTASTHTFRALASITSTTLPCASISEPARRRFGTATKTSSLMPRLVNSRYIAPSRPTMSAASWAVMERLVGSQPHKVSGSLTGTWPLQALLA